MGEDFGGKARNFDGIAKHAVRSTRQVDATASKTGYDARYITLFGGESWVVGAFTEVGETRMTW